MKAKQINQIARAINDENKSLAHVADEFRAYWAAVNKSEAKAALNSCDPKSGEHYRIERILAAAKCIKMDPNTLQAVRDLQDSGITFSDLDGSLLSWLIGTKWCAEDGAIMEEFKNKAGKGWREVQRWTPLKYAKYIRLAKNAKEIQENHE